MSRNGKTVQLISGCLGLWVEWRVKVKGPKRPLWYDGNVLKLDFGNGCITIY